MKSLNKDSAVYKMLLLGIVCGLSGLLLSAVNAVTEPVIFENQWKLLNEKLEEIYPGTEFKDVTEEYIEFDESGLVDAIYQAEDKGYVFSLHSTGYNSDGFTFMVGFDMDGKVSGFKVLEQKETEGIGSKCFIENGEYEQQILSLKYDDPIPLVSGATLTSSAIRRAMEAARDVFGILPKTNGTVVPDTEFGGETA